MYLISACVPINTRAHSPQEEQIISRTKTSLIATNAPLLISTQNPNATDTPTLSKHYTQSPIHLTPVPIITLKPQAAATVESILKDPMNCPTLCFWGIQPGITHLTDVRPIFSRLGFLPFEGIDPNSSRDFYTITYKSEHGDYSSFTLFTKEDLIENIEISPHIKKQTEGSIAREWSAYSPETLLKRFGKPSQVTIYVDWGPNFVIVMDMSFTNPDLIVRYSGYNMIPDRPHSPKLCPITASFDQVQLWLGPNPPNPPLRGIMLEDATDLSIDQFTELMTGDPEKACFTIKGDVFK